MTSPNKRFIVTLIVIITLIGGAGLSLVYEALTTANVTLADSQLFNIWLGAILGFGGLIIAALYNDKEETKTSP